MITADQLIAKHAADIAFVAEQEPATTLEDFNTQLDTAAHRLGKTWADIQGAEELETAVTYLADAIESTDDAERAVLVNRAASYLCDVYEVVEEYREMAA
ncbi:hypothetical protein OG596_39260 (plasmid) [Streptomyces sp. NBC_01102]|uniref:hypothetical protein n=1 Tax=unclassified Streptomyces TaxID=2593676 RepID=UPI002889799A|nr:hypothetical protein [Streptomyces sp. ITFR-6]WNI34634.1 hypothetical protein RLT59_39095 [Streptomyces sp. ITFR-6]WSU71401.1 hypothetical protein OG596_39260 [Streptomyces sp. NBC_01102]